MELTLHNDFYDLIEPVLQDAGYSTRVLTDGQFLVKNGDIHFTITHCVRTEYSPYERALLESRFKDPRAEALFKYGLLFATNKLSGTYPEFSVVCSTDGRLRIRYCCDISEPQDILPHIPYACDFFSKIKAEAELMLTEMYNDHQTNMYKQTLVQL